MANKGKGGRPKGPGVKVKPHLEYMAQGICRRAFRSDRHAAEESLRDKGGTISARHLARAYAEQRRALEIHSMRELATWNTRFWWKGTILCRPNHWQALLENVENLAAENPRLQELAEQRYSIVWRHIRHLPFPFHRLYPNELIDLLMAAGVDPPEG